jgi:hypothetical protein
MNAVGRASTRGREMMDGMMSGMMSGMGIIAILVIVVLILGAAALVKYLFSGR